MYKINASKGIVWYLFVHLCCARVYALSHLFLPIFSNCFLHKGLWSLWKLYFIESYCKWEKVEKCDFFRFRIQKDLLSELHGHTLQFLLYCDLTVQFGNFFHRHHENWISRKSNSFVLEETFLMFWVFVVFLFSN